MAGALLAAPLRRRQFRTWGATQAELAALMPGDELVPAPVLGYTRAVTVAAPPARVWRWLVQLGQGRGGMYSFDGLENLARCDIHTITTIRPELQTLAAGDLIRMGPVGHPCFRVISVDPGVSLVLLGADPQPPHLTPRDREEPDSAAPVATWQFLLTPDDAGTSTRLISRQRLEYPRAQSVMWHVVEPIGFVMEREMLRQISRLAESDVA